MEELEWTFLAVKRGDYISEFILTFTTANAQTFICICMMSQVLYVCVSMITCLFCGECSFLVFQECKKCLLDVCDINEVCMLWGKMWEFFILIVLLMQQV